MHVLYVTDTDVHVKISKNDKALIFLLLQEYG